VTNKGNNYKIRRGGGTFLIFSPLRGGDEGEGEGMTAIGTEFAMNKTAKAKSFSYYPVFLNLKGKETVVIGGGKVAERKILALLKAGANITVISPEITKRIAREKPRGSLKHIPRQYRKGDVKNTFLVIAATDSEEINKKVSEEAPCLVNVVDTPSLCNFIVPSVIQRGLLTIAISTGGVSPALSKSIRKELEKLYGPELAEYLRLLQKIRERAMREISDKRKRTEFLKSLVSAKVIKMLRDKGYKEVERVLLSA
jgi:precorrin-2 dehydrogenase/sirohydrochlorin ferrochelatase